MLHCSLGVLEEEICLVVIAYMHAPYLYVSCLGPLGLTGFLHKMVGVRDGHWWFVLGIFFFSFEICD